MRVQPEAEDPKTGRAAESGCLVELGGWFDHLALQELRVVARGRVQVVGPRLAVADCCPAELLRLGASRAVYLAGGFSATATMVPDALAERLSGSFGVRFHDRAHLLTEVDRRRLMSLMWRAHPSPTVDLVKPAHDIHVFAERGGLWFGERIGVCAPELGSARPRRPFCRSYETPPRKARVLVNLSGVTAGTTFVDPFCGTGALVLEAANMGCRSVGMDLDPSAVAGSMLNAADEGSRARFLLADARQPPLSPRSVEAAASDLPYGHSASQRGTPGRELYVAALDGLREPASAEARFVVMSLERDAPDREPDGWLLEWSCREEARTVVRQISVWVKS